MLNFRKSSLVFGSLILLLLMFNHYIPQYSLLLGLLTALFLYLIVYGSMRVSANFYIDSLCRGSSEDKTIGLTFDDGPDKEFTPLLLDILKAQDIKVTFFLIGNKILTNEELVRRIDAEGHLIGVHSYSHSFLFGFFSKNRVLLELQQSLELINSILGKKPKLFRPPFGVTNPNIAWAAEKLNLLVIGWSRRFFDTRQREQEHLSNKLLKKLEKGDIILLHDTQNTTIQSLENYLEFINQKGFKIVSLDKLLNIAPYE